MNTVSRFCFLTTTIVSISHPKVVTRGDYPGTVTTRLFFPFSFLLLPPFLFLSLALPFPLSYERRNECLFLPFASFFAPAASISWAIRIYLSLARANQKLTLGLAERVDEERRNFSKKKKS
ncbi:hypothetical protein F4775DRAFT_539607, partial [Biscogniauxia sp. FL1348]